LNPSAATGAQIAFTNYKGMGASTMKSLSVPLTSVGAGERQTYPNLTDSDVASVQHPDGAIYPCGSSRISSFLDGCSNTIMMVETMDNSGDPNRPMSSGSAWFDGRWVSLAGLPGYKTGTTYIEYEAPSPQKGFPFIRPGNASKEFNGRYNEEASSYIQECRTYLAYDFTDTKNMPYPNPIEGQFYQSPEMSGTDQGCKPTYGPSSGHPSVVNHVFADGSVHSIKKEVDFAMYFFAITRNNGDPSPSFE
jgi:hypothetical protein